MMPRKDIYQEVTDKIVKELEAGAVPWLKPWAARTRNGVLGAFGRPRNAITGGSTLGSTCCCCGTLRMNGSFNPGIG